MFISGTYTKSYIIFQFTLSSLTLDDILRSNQGLRNVKWLYLINGSSYDQSLKKIHIISHYGISITISYQKCIINI